MTDDCTEVETMNAGVGINPEPRHGLCGILGPLVSSVGVVFILALICVFVWLAMMGDNSGLSTTISVMSEDSFLLTIQTIELLSDDTLPWVVVLITKGVFVSVGALFTTVYCAEVEMMDAEIGIKLESRCGLNGVSGLFMSSVGVVFM